MYNQKKKNNLKYKLNNYRVIIKNCLVRERKRQ